MRIPLLGSALLLSLLLFPAQGKLLAQMPAPAVSSSRLFHLGGYGSLALGQSHVDARRDSLNLSEAAAALLISGTAWNRFSYFGELDLASRGSENWTGRQDDRTLELERLYAEYTVSDRLRVRAGRFLTPVGQWNENHAEPLTWTTLRPLTTYRPFAKSSTGILVAGETAFGGRELGYAAYLAPPNLTHDTPEESSFVHAAGARLALEVSPGTYLGVSGIAFKGSRPEFPDDGEEGSEGADSGDLEDHGEGRQEDEGDRGLLGVDLLTRVHGVELSGEAVWLQASGIEPAHRGFFLQGVVPLAGTLFGVARTERYDPVDTGPLWSYSIGATWRASSRLVVKLDRHFTDRRSERIPSGWFVSISSLF